MKKAILIAFIFLLSGCSLIPFKSESQIVKVAVPVPCKVDPIKKPDMPTDKLKKSDNIFVKTQAAFAEIDIRKGYEGQLESAIKGCQ